MANKQIKDLPEIASAALGDLLVVQRDSDSQTSRIQLSNLLTATVQVLNDLQDVDDSGKISGYILEYNGSQWVAVPNSGGSGSVVELFSDYATYVGSGAKPDGAIAYVRDATGAPGLQGITGWGFFVYDSTEVTPQRLVAAQEFAEYISQFPGTQVLPGIPGSGIEAGDTINDLLGLSYSAFVDRLVLPTVEASIQTPKSVTVDGVSAGTQEVGSSLTPTLNTTFEPGVIQNGDGSTGPDLVGASTDFEYTLPDASVINRTPAGDQDLGYNPPAVQVNFGNNSYQVEATHGAGSGSYTDNQGNIGTNLDPQRVAGPEIGTSAIVVGRYFAWFGSGGGGSTPINSAQVRALPNQFLNGSNEGTFDIVIPPGTPEVYFSIPAGKTITVLYVESSFADVTGTFTNNPFNVDDGGANPVAYDNYSAIIGGGGYPATATYRVTVS